MKKYIHERPDWPNFKFEEAQLRNQITGLHQAAGKLYGKLDALGFGVKEELLLSSVSDEVVTSSEIEGENINRSSVRSSVAKRLGLDIAGLVDIPYDKSADGIIDIALDATQNYTVPLTDERIFGWNAALFPTGFSGLRKITVGDYRKEDISVLSGAIGKEKIHYAAPPPERVPGEMKEFLFWLENDQQLDFYVKAAVAHLWFECIHPFDDGNGRIGRAIADMLLARAEDSPSRYYSLSSQLLKERNAYYKELELASGYSGSTTRWITWFLGCVSHAVEASDHKLEAAKLKAGMFEKIRNVTTNSRQLLIINALIEGFEGKLTTSKWAKICK